MAATQGTYIYQEARLIIFHKHNFVFICFYLFINSITHVYTVYLLFKMTFRNDAPMLNFL